jgi:type I restriction enzyme, S subunit
MLSVRKIIFKDFITLQRGFDLPSSKRVEGEYPVIAATSVNGYHNQYKNDPPGVVTGRSGALGEVQYIKTKFWALNTTLWVKNFKGNYPKYVYYFLKTLDLKRFNSGAGVPTLNRNDLDTLEIRIHNYSAQKKIAGVLSAYDDLIENNTRRIKILEEMAQTLYHEWFVKFRFPGHEQTKMVDSELGLIPEGWKFRKLEELGFLGRGKSKHRPRNDPSLYGGDYPFIQTGEVKEAFLYIINYNQTYNKKGLEQSKLWEAGTLLITIAANIAETAILTFPACFPDSIVGFVAYSNNVNAEFIKYSIDGIKLRMQNVSKGTTQDNLSLEKIRIFDFLVPEKETMQLFIKITTPIFSQIKNLLLKNQNLSKTRDLLLPKLISGEIDVEHLDITTEDIAA